MTSNLDEMLNALYPAPFFRATNISRMEEKQIGQLYLDPKTSRMLGEENVGIFAGNCKRLDQLLDRIRQLDSCGAGGHWVVVPSTRKASAVIYKNWLYPDEPIFVEPQTVPAFWSSNRVHFSVPEALAEFGTTLFNRGVGVAGILVIDLFCMVHKARGFQSGEFHVLHDRP